VSVTNYDHKAIQMRRGTSAEWREYGDICVPLEAEICVELFQYPDGTVNKNVGVKIGNGIDTFKQLPYVILNEEFDPIFTNHPAFNITQEEINMWNQASTQPGTEYGQVERWDGKEWIPTNIMLLKDAEGIETHRDMVPYQGSVLDIGADKLRYKNGYFDNLDTNTINLDGTILGGDTGIDISGELDDLNEKLAQEIIDRGNGDAALDQRIDELATDDLTDVNSEGATKDQFLIHNGVQWIAEDFHIDTELTFKGGISVPRDPAPTDKKNGDLYINNESGVAGASWTGIAGRTINAANAVGWSETNARWYMLGDIASAAVMAVEPGLGIDVDDSKPAEPVVSIDRTEVDKWYEPPINPKNSAFNKNFGTTNGTVAQGNHNHDGVYQPAGNYDNYSGWNVAANGTSGSNKVTKNATVTFSGSGGASVTRSGNNITISAPTSTTPPTGSAGQTLYYNSGWKATGVLTVGTGNVSSSGTFTAASGFVKSGSSNNNVLLAGGGTKPLADFNTGSGPDLTPYLTKTEAANTYEKKHSHPYVPLSGNSTISGTLTATDFIANSDIALKQNVKTAPLGLLDQIRGVEFEWKDGREASGVIANEIEKILPHLVTEQDGIKSVHMMGLLAYIIEEIKALKNG